MADIDISVGELPEAATFDDDSLLVIENQGRAQKLPGRLLKKNVGSGGGLVVVQDIGKRVSNYTTAEINRFAMNGMSVVFRDYDHVSGSRGYFFESHLRLSTPYRAEFYDATNIVESAGEIRLKEHYVFIVNDNEVFYSDQELNGVVVPSKTSQLSNDAVFISATEPQELTPAQLTQVRANLQITGTGGGGGETNNATLTVTNTTGWIYKTIAANSSCPVSLEWSSMEGDLSTGPGVVKVTVNETVKYQASVEQGVVGLDLEPYLATGANEVKITISDIYGNSRSIKLSVTVVALILTSPFDTTTPRTGSFGFPYVPTAAATKTVYFLVDGVKIGTQTVTTSGRQQTFTVPAQSHGSHTLEVWFEAIVDGTKIPSNSLYYDIICLEEGNTTPVIASDFREAEVEQYDSTVIRYQVYTPDSMTSPVTLSANGVVLQDLTVDRTLQTWSYLPDTAGDLTLTIASGTAKPKVLQLTVLKSSIDVEAETEDLSLYLSSYGRSNNEANPGQWEGGDIVSEFSGFNFVSDGWQTDEDGITVLRISGDARLTVPLLLFEKDFRGTGKTIEIEFATRNVLNYDAVILSCFSDNRGIQITAQKALLKSEGAEISTQYKEDEHVRLTFVVEKSTTHRLLMIYLNGILSGVKQYAANDDFSQGSPVGITVGSNDCTIDLYTIRVYDNDLTRFQVLDNWIADTQIAALRGERWRHNNVFDKYGSIVIANLPKDLPYLVFECPELPQAKDTDIKKDVAGRYVDPVDPSRSFTFTGAEVNVQGTSSAGYARKNYKVKFKGGFIQNGVAVEGYQLRSDSVPTDVFTFKADVASSEGANNVELVKLYNDICPYRTPPQEADSRVRQGIDGYPIVIFHDAGDGPVFIGKYNFNNDKGTEEVFGFTPGDESWETRNNTSNRALFKSADFSGTDWQNDYEARYPDKNTDASNLAALAAWIASTDPDGTDSREEKQARIVKFQREVSNWLDLDSTLFYYLFTELFLLADSRAKNSFPTRYVGDKWCWLPYDMDTALGTNNEGALTFSYELEDIDYTSTGANIYTGQASVLWKNVRAAFQDELMAMYQTLRSQTVLSYEDTMQRFEQHQAIWPEAIFNEDSYYKYLQPLFESGTAAYLSMLQGSKSEQRKWWLYNRFRYIDSKYQAGDAVKDFITIRAYAKGDITVTPYADIYASIKYGSYLVQKRALRGSSYTLACPLDDMDDTEVYVYSASQLSQVGDLSPLHVGYADFAPAVRLKALKLGGVDGYENLTLTQLYLGNNVLLKTLDVRNCRNLGNLAEDEEATTSVDLSGCTGLEEVYFDNTAVLGVVLPNGGGIKALHLPGTITNLTIQNQPKMTEFVLPSYAQITTLRLENVSDLVPKEDIFRAISEGSRVRMLGFDFNYRTVSGFLARLRTMRGLDENGNNTAAAQMSGSLHVEHLWKSDEEELRAEYPDVTVTCDRYTESIGRALVGRSLSGPYRNDRITALYANNFMFCFYVTVLDLPNVTVIDGSNVFGYTQNLKALILRSESLCVLKRSDTFGQSSIVIGTGYIYVPKTLADGSDGPTTYASATNWSAYATKFRAIEDYPDVCGG